MNTTLNENSDILKLVYEQGRSASPTVSRPDGGVGVIVPQDYAVVQFEPVNKPEPALLRIAADVTLHERDSFIAYINRYKTNKTQLFAEAGFLRNGQGARVVADLDYHLPDTPQRRQHFASYMPRYSDQWKRWHQLCAQPLKQVEFAEAIEELRNDIVEPKASALLDIVRAFKANKKTDFDSVVYQADGGVKLAYSEQVQQQGTSGTLPELMQLGIPVYFRGAVYKIGVWLRFKVGGGGVQFTLKMDRADVIEDAAFDELTSTIAEKSGCPLYLGHVK